MCEKCFKLRGRSYPVQSVVAHLEEWLAGGHLENHHGDAMLVTTIGEEGNALQ